MNKDLTGMFQTLKEFNFKESQEKFFKAEKEIKQNPIITDIEVINRKQYAYIDILNKRFDSPLTLDFFKKIKEIYISSQDRFFALERYMNLFFEFTKTEKDYLKFIYYHPDENISFTSLI